MVSPACVPQEAMDIAVVGCSQRRNKNFERLHGVKAGSSPVPVTIRVYLVSGRKVVT